MRAGRLHRGGRGGGGRVGEISCALSCAAAVAGRWRSKTIKDEPVKVSNKPGYITFAKTGAPNRCALRPHL